MSCCSNFCCSILVVLVTMTNAKQPFQMVSTLPKNQNATVQEGESFTLSCNVNKYIRSCVWRHLDKSCFLRYSAAGQGLVKSKCLIFDQKIDVRGNYARHECQILIHRAMPTDSGVWKCEVREYVSSLAIFATPKVVTKNFRVHVKSPDPIVEVKEDGLDVGVRIGGQTVHEYLGTDENEAQERHWALIGVSTGFGIFILIVLIAISIVVMKRYGLFQRMSDRSQSVKLTDIEEDDVRAGVQNKENEKAMSRLGVITYATSQRVF
ncbi:hypothetical protein TCAL_14381 [Tigriopus californicus]|uniref:Ig-like domain-containing protein n=1 Tax=Tigriopus californicus TaxID=6832 RepID=A0A553PJD3_TIGCA|nr:hypothetical protein TCAL_14381 [Tigriopus californicus]